MNIKQKFLELTSRTYPHGTESLLFPILHSTADGLEQDEFGNLFVMIGKSDVMFTSHLDTATSQNVQVNHVIDGDIIKTDGTSILGADDKAGVTIMLYMIQNKIPGLYYFFLGEEVGCVGSKKLSAKHGQNKIEGINKVISFDRRGTTSVISFQSSKRCASDAFTNSLAEQLNKADADFKYKTDDTGVLTDSFQFVSIYPECSNISVGYQSEHTFGETQDIKHLEKLAKACLLVDWNSLPVERDPSKVEYKSYGGYYDYDGYYDYPSSNSRRYSSNNWGSITKPITENKWFHDKKWNYVSKVEYEKWTNKVVNVDLHEGRILEEESIIFDFLKSLEIEFDKIDWDGVNLKIIREGDSDVTKMKKVSDRNELIEFLPELDYIKNSPNKFVGRNPLDFDYSNDYYDDYWD